MIRQFFFIFNDYLCFYFDKIQMQEEKQQAKQQSQKKNAKISAQNIVQTNNQTEKGIQQNVQNNPFDFSEMKTELANVNKTQEHQTYFDPYLQAYQTNPVLVQQTPQNRTNQSTKNRDQCRDSNEEQRYQKRGHDWGHRRGHHHHHKKHRGWDNRDHSDPQNQQQYSDQYWHQVHDKRHYHHPHPHHYPHPHPPFHPSWHYGGHHHPRQQYFEEQPPPPYPEQPNYPHYFQGFPPQPPFVHNPPPHPYPPFYPSYFSNGVYPPFGYPNYPVPPQVNQETGVNEKDQISRESSSSQIGCKKSKRWRQKDGKQQKCWGKWKGKKHSRSRSRSSSSSSNQSRQEELNQLGKQYMQNIKAAYSSNLQNLFQSRSINTLQRQKIIKLLIDRFPKFDAPFQMIFNSLAQLESQNLLYQMPYIKVIKILLKFNFNMTYATPKIMRIQEKKIKKYESDLKYNSLYGDIEVQPLLQHGTLIDMDQTNVIYLIDGNNILPTQKHFRKYFQSCEKLEKVEAQLRCEWLVSFAIEPQNCLLFFDQKFVDADTKKVANYLFPNQQQMNRANKIKVIYGDQTTADNKIVEKLTELVGEDNKKEVILVSADRQLYMRCTKIAKIKHTGGRFFFKFIKYVGVHRNKQQKQVKKTIKKIMSYIH